MSLSAYLPPAAGPCPAKICTVICHANGRFRNAREGADNDTWNRRALTKCPLSCELCWKMCRCSPPTALFEDIKHPGMKPQVFRLAFLTIWWHIRLTRTEFAGFHCLINLFCGTRNWNSRGFWPWKYCTSVALTKWLIIHFHAVNINSHMVNSVVVASLLLGETWKKSKSP